VRALYAGTVGMAHGLETLLDAVERIEAGGEGPPLEALIAGDGAEAAGLRERLASGGPSGVRMLGARPSAEIPGLYASADIAVVMLRDRPIFHGALPTKMLEAMAAGRPVVLSARGEAARLIEASEAGLVVAPEDPGELAAALATLASDPELRARLGAAGRRAVEREFGRDAWLGRWRQVLADAAGA
jgi:glycosyltransferase involved in cell wall biosynthesis